MNARIVVDAPRPAQELSYVTAHFRDLQGLRMAPFWAALLILTQFQKFHFFPTRQLAWAAGILTLMQFGWLYISGRWYARTYGQIREAKLEVPSGLASIMQPERGPAAAFNRNYGRRSGQFAVLFLTWALSLLPGLFLSHGHRNSGQFAMLLTAFLVLPRCFYPVISDLAVLLRRILAITALVVIVGFYFDYRFARMELWNWMATLPAVLLTLDLYDHWLLNHLLGGGFPERTHE